MSGNDLFRSWVGPDKQKGCAFTDLGRGYYDRNGDLSRDCTKRYYYPGATDTHVNK